MNILHTRNLFKMKSVLCMLLMLYGPVVLTGCGNNPLGPGVPIAQLQIPISPDGSLSQALAGTSFQGAVAIAIMPASQQFRLIFRDDVRQVSGFYALKNGEFTLTGFSFKNADGSASVRLDSERKVESITTSGGESWERLAQDLASARTTVTSTDPSANPYMAANADLIQFAASMDQSTAVPTPSSSTSSGALTSLGALQATGKANNADSSEGGGLRIVLSVIAAIWAPLAGILTPLLAFFTVASIIEKSMVLRFDGTWTATNASSNLLVTIDGGKITKLVDADSSQELTVVDSRLDRLEGNHVVWNVTANVLGQPTNVDFTFDVQELSNGSLEGTLTALGSTFARVAVTMTRV